MHWSLLYPLYDRSGDLTAMSQNATGPNGINSLTESPDNKGLNGTNEKQKIKNATHK